MPDQPSETVQNIILRFRDLVTGPGGTIERHNAISSEAGYVWWGWWNKLGEQVPVATFTAIAEKIHAQGKLQILLMDSGRNKVFKAECVEIRWDAGRQLIASPEPDHTPDYYRGERYLAWFKLGPIEEVADTELRQLTYLRVDEFFTDNRSNYDEFYGKQIYSPAELQQQNRTIWFVRQHRTGDPSHFVRLLDASRISPSDFPERPLVTERGRLLWVSDLHFSVDGHHGFPDKTDEHRRDLWNALEEALKEEPKLAGMLVSGDLTWKADPAEYDRFVNFVRYAVSTTRWENNYYLTVCPGNHDLSFSTDEPQKGSEAVKAGEAARREYERAYDAVFYLPPNQYLCSGRRYILKNGIPVEVAALNSSFLQQTKELFQGHGFVGAAQLDFVADKMGWRGRKKTENGAFRIAMLHHHLMPVTYREAAKVDTRSSIVFDANAVIEWIASHEIDLVLHGHQHQPFCAKLSYPLRSGGKPEGAIESWHEFHVLGLGSTGVEVSHLGETKENTYGVLEFSPVEVCVTVRSISSTRTAASPLWSVTIPIRR